MTGANHIHGFGGKDLQVGLSKRGNFRVRRQAMERHDVNEAWPDAQLGARIIRMAFEKRSLDWGLQGL